jgi:hypothetical protein
MTLFIYVEKIQNQLYVDDATGHTRMMLEQLNQCWSELQDQLISGVQPETHAHAESRKVNIAAQLNPSASH